MSIQDFRGQGPPADIGTFQSPCSILIYQYTFSGTTYVCAARQGDRGWVLVTPPSTVASTVINAAIVANPNGAEFYVKRANYSITATIIDSGSNDISIDCEQGTVFTLANTVNAPVIFLTSCARWIFRNLKIDGNRVNQAGGPFEGIAMNAAVDCEFEHLWFINVGERAIAAAVGSDRVQMLNCKCENSGKGFVADASEFALIQGCYCNNVGAGLADDCHLLINGSDYGQIVDCRVHQCLGDGASIYTSSHCRVAGLIADNYGLVTDDHVGVDLHTAIRSVVEGCVFYGCNYGVILDNSSERNVVANNEVVLSGRAGIILDSLSRRNLISGNMVDGSGNIVGYAGIHVESERNTICDNKVLEDRTGVARTQTIGININGGDFNLISDNYIVNNKTYGIFLAAGSTYNQIEDNFTADHDTGCLRIDNANCLKNTITHNCFEEGAISDAGGAHGCVAYLNYDPSAGAMIATINPPAVVGGGGGALP
jgi:parallel beta-helix repeat protein